jgi:hypothetical protein
MSTTDCTLSMLVARPDLPFMMQTLPHRLRMLNFPFAERLVIMDTAPLTGNYAYRTDIGSLAELRARCEELRAASLVDRIVEIDCHNPAQQKIYTQQFSKKVRDTRDFRGYPNIGWVLAIAEATTDYVLYFDSDMLLYQAPKHNWVREGIDLLQKNPEILFVAPLPGPPTGDKTLKQRGVPYELDPRGFYRFKNFTSRKFLTDRRRFSGFLPLDPTYVSWKRRLLGLLTGQSAMETWEVMVSRKLAATNYIRADLTSPNAWTLHPAVRPPEFYEALPEIIAKIERGWFPPEQAGDYDLQLKTWLR